MAAKMSTALNDERELVMQDVTSGDNLNNKEQAYRFKAGVYLASVTGISALIGFGSAVASVKKKDPEFYNKGILGNKGMPETGGSLAMRALGWGTLYAFVGCGVLFYSIWKLVGAHDMKEFRIKVGSVLPRIPKNDPPEGRTEFEGLSDILNYVSSAEASKRTVPVPER